MTEAEGRQLAQANGAEYIEASARHGDNVVEAFETLVRRWNGMTRDGGGSGGGGPGNTKKKAGLCRLL